MLDAIRHFFRDELRTEAPGTDPEQALRLATAALVVEALKADQRVETAEQSAALDGLVRLFDLSEERATELFHLAERTSAEGTSLFPFTHLIDRNYSAEEKVRIVELLWQIAYADGHKDDREEHLIRQVTDLLHVSHSDFIRARLRAEAGLSED